MQIFFIGQCRINQDAEFDRCQIIWGRIDGPNVLGLALQQKVGLLKLKSGYRKFYLIAGTAIVDK